MRRGVIDHARKAVRLEISAKALQQILPGHTKLESSVRYLGIEVDDAPDLAERQEV